MVQCAIEPSYIFTFGTLAISLNPNQTVAAQCPVLQKVTNPFFAFRSAALTNCLISLADLIDELVSIKADS